MDAFDVDYFPWAGSPALPIYTGEGKARVFNSIFFGDPPFFGLDINPPEGWHHVVGSKVYATLNGRPISPTLDPQWQPRDGDRILLHGHLQDQFVRASYVGISGSAPFYYRSLLLADELQLDRLPPAYDSLFVWVRGELDVSEGSGRFYTLPEGASLEPQYVGQEAIVSGELVFGDSITVSVTGEVFVREGVAHVRIFDGSAWSAARRVSHRGTIVELDASSSSLFLKRSDGVRVQVRLGADTRFRFADGSPATVDLLRPGQVVEIQGHTAEDASVSAAEITITAVETVGQPHAVFVPADSDGLWSMGLVDRERHLLLTPPQAESGCSLESAQLSPDARAAVIECTDGEQTYLMTADVQSKEWRKWLGDDDWNESHPTWSPEAQRLVFCRHQIIEGQRVDAGLWVLSLHGASVTQICTAAPGGLWSTDPQWSPDGKHIAYGQVNTTGEQPAALHVLTFPNQQRQVVDEARDWRWSPDSTQLLVTRQPGNQARSRLWIVQRDGTSLTWLSITGVNDQEGRWSPNGRSIAFLSRPWPSSGLDRLCLMQASGMRRVQPQAQPFASSLAWSADGSGILFMRLDEDGQPRGLWMAQAEGLGLTPLAEDAIALIGSYGAESESVAAD